MYTKQKYITATVQASVEDVMPLWAAGPPLSPQTQITTQPWLSSLSFFGTALLGFCGLSLLGFFWHLLMIKLCSGVGGRISAEMLCPVRNRTGRWQLLLK